MTRHWSGKHRKTVRGINLITLLWTDGGRKIPCDYRLYSKTDGKTKNDHFWEMMLMARGRGFSPKYVLFDCWYASLENLKQIRDNGWLWLTRLKGNRKVTPADGRARTLDEVTIGATGTVLHLTGYGSIRIFRFDVPDGDTEWWATNDLGMDELTQRQYAEQSFAIENYHRDLKQDCGVEKCQIRSERAQRNHIGLAIRAFLRLEDSVARIPGYRITPPSPCARSWSSGPGLGRAAPAAGLPIPRPARAEQGGPLGRGPGTQASGGRHPQIAAGPSQLEGGQACRSAEEADRAEGG